MLVRKDQSALGGLVLDGKGYSTIKTVRGVLQPAFQMAVDDACCIRFLSALNWQQW